MVAQYLVGWGWKQLLAQIPYKNEFYETYKDYSGTSQNGEDGVIRELLRRLDITSGHVVEFGTLDGVEFSNTNELLKRGFKGVYLECNPDYVPSLERLKEQYGLQYKITRVEPTGENTLDNVLESMGVPDDIAVLSIDIDSNDARVFESIERYNPAIVLVECCSAYNPWDLSYVYGPRGNHVGNGFAILHKIGVEKGYTFICHTMNMVYVRNDLVDKLNLSLPKEPLENFRRDWVHLGED